MNWNTHPLLCLYRTNDEPLRRYMDEVLLQEGYLATDRADLDVATDLPAVLAGRALVVVSAVTLDDAEIKALLDFVGAGGRAVFIRPDERLIEALRLPVAARPHPVYGDAPPAYLRLAPHPWTTHHADALIQIHAPVRMWRLDGVAPLAFAAANRAEHAGVPAVFETPFGSGRLAVFQFDPGQSLVRTRQGDPRRASNSAWPREDAGIVKPGTMFLNFLDPELRHVPQADVLADLLVGIIRGLTDDLLPLPRIWHLPEDGAALTLADGDSDLYDWDCYRELVEPLLAAGIPYTLNLMPAHLRALDRAVAGAWLAKGNDFQLHYRYPGHTPSVADLRQAVPEQQRLFEDAFGRRSVGSRAHSLLWPGYTEPAEIYAEHGARMETNFMPFRAFQYGYCGSARAARFSRADGTLINLSQQPTVFMDDPMSNDKSGLPARSPDEAYAVMTRFYDESATRYHGVLCTCLHPVPPGQHDGFRAVQAAMRQAIIDGTRRHHLPALTMRDWCAFHEARRELDLRLKDGAWQVAAGGAIHGLTLHRPVAAGVLRQGWNWSSQQMNLAGDEHQTLTTNP
jgi:hypothetical protein